MNVDNIALFLLKFALTVFATYRIAFEMSAHFGIMDIFHRLREKAQVITIENPEKNLFFLDEMMRCATCLSMFVAVPFVLILFGDMKLIDQTIIYFAVNGVIVWLHFKLMS